VINKGEFGLINDVGYCDSCEDIFEMIKKTQKDNDAKMKFFFFNLVNTSNLSSLMKPYLTWRIFKMK
jgi:hypothetical protein